MKRLYVEKNVFKKCAKKRLAMLMATLAFSVSAPAGSLVLAAPEEDEVTEETEEQTQEEESAEAVSEEQSDEEAGEATAEEGSVEEGSSDEESAGEASAEESDTEGSAGETPAEEAVAEESKTEEAAETQEIPKDSEIKEETTGSENAAEEQEADAFETTVEEEQASEEIEDEVPAAEDTEEVLQEDVTVSDPNATELPEDLTVSDPNATELPEDLTVSDPNAIELNLDLDALPVKEMTEEDKEEEQEEEAVYDGIVIDGKFSDWDGVAKTDAGGSTDYQDFLEACAVFQDGDYIYVYIRDTGIGAASWSGPHGNGQFSLVTDLGYSVLFQLHATDNGAHVSISGVNGAECAYYTKGWGYSGEWEISIPVSELPNSRGTFAFGYYQADPFIGEVADQREKDDVTGNTNGEGNGDGQNDEIIIFDGLYGDWSTYPHTLIHYATSGTWEKYVDGEGALYSTGGMLYGHVVTRMNAHLTEHGEEMQYGVVLRINQDNNLWFEFRLIDVDENGRINWNVNVSDQENGTHEYYIVDTRGWSSAQTLDEIDEGNHVYGRMRITKGDISDEAEWKLDLGLIAENFGLEETDMQVLEVRYERIGDKWLQTAGASTGPVAGILLSMAVAGYAVVLQRRKKVI